MLHGKNNGKKEQTIYSHITTKQLYFAAVRKYSKVILLRWPANGRWYLLWWCFEIPLRFKCLSGNTSLTETASSCSYLKLSTIVMPLKNMLSLQNPHLKIIVTRFLWWNLPVPELAYILRTGIGLSTLGSEFQLRSEKLLELTSDVMQTTQLR